MSGKVVEYIIRVKDLGSAAIRRFTSTLASTVRSAAGIGKSLADAIFRPTWLKAAGISSLFAGLAATIRQAFKVETALVQFSVLLKSMEKAKAMLAELKQFSDATPFEFNEIAAAAKTLLGFGVSAGDVIQTLRRLGDVAAGSGADLKSLAVVYGQIRSAGKLMGQDLLQLINNNVPMLGGLSEELYGVAGRTSDVRKAIEDGKVSFEVFDRALSRLTTGSGTFAGMMDKLSTTGEGLFSTLLGEWSGALADFGKELMALAKDGIGFAITKIKELRENGTITRWAKETNEALTLVKDTLASIFSGDTATISLSVNVVKEGLKDAFSAGLDLLLDGASKVGRMIWAGFSSAGPLTSKELRDAEKELGGPDRGAFGYGAFGVGTGDIPEAVKARARQNREKQAMQDAGVDLGGPARASGFGPAVEQLRAHLEAAKPRLSPQDAVNKAFPPIATPAAPMPAAAAAVASAAAGSPTKPAKPGKPNVAAMTRALLDMNAGTGLTAAGAMATAAPLEGLDAYISDHSGGGRQITEMLGARPSTMGKTKFMAGLRPSTFRPSTKKGLVNGILKSASAGIAATAPGTGSLLDPQKQVVDRLDKINNTLERKLGMRR